MPPPAAVSLTFAMALDSPMPHDDVSSEPAPIVIGREGRRPVASSITATHEGTAVSTPWAVGSLLVVNMVPLAGVLFLGWSTLDLMLLYWFENGVVGLFALLKILLTRGRDGDATGVAAGFDRLVLASFFVLHYGAFWTVHGLFVVVLFGGAGAADAAFSPMSGPLWFFFGGLGIAGTMLRGALLLTAMGLLVSHAVSFIGNVLQRGEDLDRPPKELMTRPYGRVVVLHVTLVLGGGLMMLLGEPVIGLALFVALKTAVDLGAHLRSHQPRATQ